MLIVDDDAEVRAVGADLLAVLGHQVYEAQDAQEALALLTTHDDIAVLFTDVHMSRMNGAELARRAQSIRPDLRVVLTSGYMGDVDRALDLPLVPKPWRLDLLAGVLGSTRERNTDDDGSSA